MKYLDEFRDSAAARLLVETIQARCSRRWVLMEVCGGQTHSLLRHGIAEALVGSVELIHGPGCPVCVTPSEDIDLAQRLAAREDVVVASFGDMLRVPGQHSSLLETRAAGGNVRIVYSPLDAVAMAQKNPRRHVVFFAVGFETTAPATALAALQARQLGLQNFSLLVSHVRVQPAMESLMQSADVRVQAFLAAGHVCTVTGYESYDEFAARHRVPVVVTGFEPVDLLRGILDCVEQLESGRHVVTNQYSRTVRRAGNQLAQDVVQRVYQVADCPWRGFGVIAEGGLRLRPEFADLDARTRFRASSVTQAVAAPTATEESCPAAEVLAGRMKPVECPHFGTGCTPDSPLGAPMVSSEGACAAYFRYHGASGGQPVPLDAATQEDT